jgi:hypothetical protein
MQQSCSYYCEAEQVIQPDTSIAFLSSLRSSDWIEYSRAHNSSVRPQQDESHLT